MARNHLVILRGLEQKYAHTVLSSQSASQDGSGLRSISRRQLKALYVISSELSLIPARTDSQSKNSCSPTIEPLHSLQDSTMLSFSSNLPCFRLLPFTTHLVLPTRLVLLVLLLITNLKVREGG